jgi:hypothetical protein
MKPPMKASGIEEAAKGQKSRRSKWPALQKLMKDIPETRRLRSKALPRIPLGAKPKRERTAR